MRAHAMRARAQRAARGHAARRLTKVHPARRARAPPSRARGRAGPPAASEAEARRLRGTRGAGSAAALLSRRSAPHAAARDSSASKPAGQQRGSPRAAHAARSCAESRRRREQPPWPWPPPWQRRRKRALAGSGGPRAGQWRQQPQQPALALAGPLAAQTWLPCPALPASSKRAQPWLALAWQVGGRLPQHSRAGCSSRRRRAGGARAERERGECCLTESPLFRACLRKMKRIPYNTYRKRKQYFEPACFVSCLPHENDAIPDSIWEEQAILRCLNFR